MRRPSPPTSLPSCEAILALGLWACFLAVPLAPVKADGPQAGDSWRFLLAENERLARDFHHLVQAGRTGDAVPIAEACLAASRRLLQAGPPDGTDRQVIVQTQGLVDSLLQWLAAFYSGREDWVIALRWQEELTVFRQQAYGRDDYRSADSLREKEYLLFVSRQDPDDARQLARAERLVAQGWTLESQRQPRDAVPLVEEALQIRRKLLGGNQARTADALALSGRLMSDLGEHARAEPLYREALAINRRVLGESHPDFARSLNDLASVCFLQAAYDQAEPLYLEALEVTRRVAGVNHPGYAAGLGNLALLYKTRGDYARAEPLYRQVLEIYGRMLGTDHPAYATALSNLANLHLTRGDYDQAEPLLRETLAIRRKALGDEHPDLAGTLNDLASLLGDRADYAGAEPLYLQALAIHRKNLGGNHPEYLSSLGNLAGLYSAQGDCAKAMPLFQQAAEGTRRTFGEKHPRYAMSLNNLAGACRAEGDYARAEPLLRQALEIVREARGEDNADYAAILNNLAGVYQAQSAYARAEPLLRQDLEIKRRVFGDGHPSYAVSVNNLAALSYDQGDYARAESLCREALEIYRRVFGEDHPDYARAASNLAAVYCAMGDSRRAEPLCRQAAEIRGRVLGKSHPGYAASLNNLGVVYRLQADFPHAEPPLREAWDIMHEQMATAAVAQSQRQQLAMLADVRFYLDSYLTVAVDSGRFSDEACRRTLAWKGAVLRRQRLARAAAQTPELRETFRQLQEAVSRLTLRAWAVPDPKQEPAYRKTMADLSERKDRLEADLAARSTAFVNARHQATLEDLRAALPEDVGLVDFLEYDHAGPAETPGTAQTWQRRLLAFVVTGAKPVKMISLGPSQPVGKAIDVWRASFGESPEGEEAGRQLRRLVWTPLEEGLRQARIVLLSPDGPLCRFPFGALPGRNAGTYLLEERAVAVVPVPQQIPDLLSPPDRKPLPSSLLLLGNVDYDSSPGAANSEAQVVAEPRQRTLAEDLVYFDSLAGTQAEIASIERLYRREVGNQVITTLERAKAGKRALLAAAPRHRYLHLATHGFFLEGPPVSAGSDSQRKGRFGEMLLRPDLAGLHPALLSGLALAGANRAGRIGKTGEAAGDDGVMTAEEVGVQNLDGVELVVLSACETGLGEAVGGEGLLSLERSFQAAGARTVVASLWSVPDEETRRLMEAFYENLWQKRIGMLESLRDAQLSVLRGESGQGATDRGRPQPASQPKRLAPRYWAAFVLSGDWR